MTACAQCGNPFELSKHQRVKARRGQTRFFCTQRCWLKTHNNPERNAAVSRAVRGNGDLQRGRGEGKHYRKYFGRHEHRVVAEQKIGRPLAPGEVVHHINEDKLDNRPENLHVFASQAEHARHHAELRRAAA